MNWATGPCRPDRSLPPTSSYPRGPSLGAFKVVPSRLDSQPTKRSEERRVGKECRSRCDWSSDVCSSDLLQTRQEPAADELVPQGPELGGLQGGAEPFGQPAHQVGFFAGGHLDRVAHLRGVYHVRRGRLPRERDRDHLRGDELPAEQPAEPDPEREYRRRCGILPPRTRTHGEEWGGDRLVEHRVVERAQQRVLLRVGAHALCVVRMSSQPCVHLSPLGVGESAVNVGMHFDLGQRLHFTTFRGITFWLPSSWRMRSRARDRRDMTVPMGISRARLTCSYVSCSTATSRTTSRCSVESERNTRSTSSSSSCSPCVARTATAGSSSMACSIS